MPQRHEFEVIVGNIGTVYSGGSRSEAMKKFTTYRLQSKAGHGRAGGESVTLMEDGEPIKEHFGTQENPASIRAQVRRLPSGQIQLKIPIGRSENPQSVIAQLKKVFGKRVKAVEMVQPKRTVRKRVSKRKR